MKVTCGTDIIEIYRVKELIEDAKERALDRIFTKKEQEYCEGKGKVKYQHYAVRFAAKEAIFKAVSNNLNDKFELTWTDVEVINDKNGRPSVHFLEKSIKDLESIEISLSHCKEYASANCIAVWTK